MIDSSIAAFLESAVMTILASRDGDFRPAIGRGVGTRCPAGGQVLETMVSRAQWPRLVDNLAPGAPIAATFVKVDDYQTYQVKGIVEEIALASEADQALTRVFHRDVRRALSALGVTEGQIAFWLTDIELHRLRYRVSDLFVQTPGPRAGMRLELRP